MKRILLKNKAQGPQHTSRPEVVRSVRNYRLSRQMAAVLFFPMILLASCSPAAAPTPTATTSATLTPVATQGLVGTWTSTVTKEDILRVVPDFDTSYVCENAGTFTWKFNADGTLAIDQTPLPGCATPANPHIEDTWSADGNLVTFAKGTPGEEKYEWIVQGDMLSFKHISGECVPCKAVNTANPWKRLSR